MAQNTITNVWIEGQIDENGIGLTLLSESREGQAQVEEIRHFSFDELSDMSGDLFTMNLSDPTREAIVGNEAQSEMDELLAEVQAEIDKEPTIERGDWCIDENAPDWSQDDTVEVVRVTGYDARNFDMDDTGNTVADANPHYPETDNVIIAQYLDEHGQPSGKEYAFPESRLSL